MIVRPHDPRVRPAPARVAAPLGAASRLCPAADASGGTRLAAAAGLAGRWRSRAARSTTSAVLLLEELRAMEAGVRKRPFLRHLWGWSAAASECGQNLCPPSTSQNLGV